MNYVRDFMGFINKDVRGRNETKTIPVMLRTVSVVMIGYYLVYFALIVGKGQIIMSAMTIIGVLIFLLGFVMTYNEKTQFSVIMTHAYGMIWSIAFILFYGWRCGAQLFFAVLLLLGFVTSYSNYLVKCLYAVLLLALRIVMYFIAMNIKPIYANMVYEEVAFQILNSVVFFTIIATVVVIFTKNSISMEEKLKTYNEQLIKLASVDSLTGLQNRRCMMEHLQRYVEELEKEEDKKLTVVIGDIDFFKRFNDQYGHACGDEVLLQLSAVFTDFMEDQGTVARWGGEEFLLVFEEKDANDTLIQMNKLLHRIRLMEVRYGGEALRVTMTFGIAEYIPGTSIDVTISNADKKLYIGKQNGRNRVVSDM